ncbi:unnamed protein product [Brassica oleracea var. botrytis]
MVKHWVADGFTPNETFQVNRKERVGFIIQEEHTCALEKKKGVSPYDDMVISGINKSHSSHMICQENMKMDPHEGRCYVFQLGRYRHWMLKKRRNKLIEDHG